jgi:carboxymethylenebutenolidase
MVEQKDPIFLKGDRNVTYKVEGKEDCQGYYIKNDSQYGLVVISEWWGLNKSICTTSETFANQGFQTIVPDIYRGENAIDREHAGHLMGGLDFKEAVKDIIGAAKFLKESGCKKIGVIGFCMGGALSLASVSVSTEFDAALPYYGIPSQDYFPVKNTKCPVLFQSGSKDDLKGFSDPQTAKSLAETAQKEGLKFDITIWEDAQHAFMNQDSEKFNKKIAAESLEYSITWLKKVFTS